MYSTKRRPSLTNGSSKRRRETHPTLHGHLWFMMHNFLPQVSLSSVAGMPSLPHFMLNHLLVSGGFTKTLLNRLTTGERHLKKLDTMILAIFQRVTMKQALKFATLSCESANRALTTLDQNDASYAFELALSFGSVEAGDALCEMYDMCVLNRDVNYRALSIAHRLKTPTAEAICVIEWCDRTNGWPSFVAMDMRLHVGGNSPCSLYAMSRLLECSGEPMAVRYLEIATEQGYHRAVVDYAQKQVTRRGFSYYTICSRLLHAAQNCSSGAITMIVQLLLRGVFRIGFFTSRESIEQARRICQQAMDNGVVEKQAF